jgi:hypothetical protein
VRGAGSKDSGRSARRELAARAGRAQLHQPPRAVPAGTYGAAPGISNTLYAEHQYATVDEAVTTVEELESYLEKILSSIIGDDSTTPLTNCRGFKKASREITKCISLLSLSI